MPRLPAFTKQATGPGRQRNERGREDASKAREEKLLSFIAGEEGDHGATSTIVLQPPNNI